VYAADQGNLFVVNDTLKGNFSCQVRIQEMTARELSKRRRNPINDVKTEVSFTASGQVQGASCLLPVRHPAYR
jgi:hypothetical protein